MSSRLIALSISVLLLAIGGSAPAFAQSAADQSAGDKAGSQASNGSATNQGAAQSQSSGSSCSYGCGGSGQAQWLSQNSNTVQEAASEANAYKNGVNANVPVSVGGGDVYGGDSSATQDLDNKADSEASNAAETNQYATQDQTSNSHCKAGCGGSGQAQRLEQNATTEQKAKSEANAHQNGVNANVPVSIGGGDVYGGNSSADQTLENKADSKATNDAETNQGAFQFQDSGSGCSKGCGGSGQSQWLEQNANTEQKAKSEAKADQDAVNVNAPISIGDGKKDEKGDRKDKKDNYDSGKGGGDSSATQDLTNKADSKASNDAETNQWAEQDQTSGCGCDKGDKKDSGSGGSGQAQWLKQNANTEQKAKSEAKAEQDAVNVNVPISIAGGDDKKGRDCGCSGGGYKGGGDSSATQDLTNKAESKATNDAETNQDAFQSQDGGSGCDKGCGGPGQAQGLVRNANTVQKAKSEAKAKQKAVNVNAPVKVKKGRKGDHPKPWKERE